MLCRRSDELLRKLMLLVQRVPPQELIVRQEHLFRCQCELLQYGSRHICYGYEEA